VKRTAYRLLGEIFSKFREISFWSDKQSFSIIFTIIFQYLGGKKDNFLFPRSEAEGVSPNVRDIRSFSGTKWKKNLGKARAEG